MYVLTCRRRAMQGPQRPQLPMEPARGLLSSPSTSRDFPGGTVVKNPPANAEQLNPCAAATEPAFCTGNPFQTTQGNRLSCRDQEGRGGSEEAVPGRDEA